MPREGSNSAALDAAVARGHQNDGVRERTIAIVGLGMAVALPLFMIILWLQFRSSEPAGYQGLTRPRIDNPQSQPSKAMPEPQLEINPGSNLAKFRAAENAELNSYAWIDRSSNVIRIPIKRAMELIVQRGLPSGGPAKSEYELILQRSRDRNLAPLKEVR